MKRFFSIIAIIAMCASASAQTVKPLAYNMTNGTVMVSTNVTWSNSFNFSTNTVANQVRTNLGLGWSALTNTNAATSLLGYTTNGEVIANITQLDFNNDVRFVSNAIILGQLFMADASSILFDGDCDIIFGNEYTRQQWINALQITWAATNISATRTNLGIPLTALTNTNSANFRFAIGALATNGSAAGLTNFPGVTTNISVVGTNNTNTLVFTNGLLMGVQ